MLLHLAASSSSGAHLDSSYDLLAIAGFVLTGIAALAVGWVVWRSKTQAANLAIWRENATALKARSDEQEVTIRDLTAKVETLTDQLGALSKVVTQAREIKEIRDKQDEYQAQLLRAIGGAHV
jgi:hypothetical protein